MNYNLFEESPLKNVISFDQLIESLEKTALSDNDYLSLQAKVLLQDINKIPELKTGIEDLNLITKNENLLSNLLSNLFPNALSDNEIKAVTIPFHNIIFNFTNRFQRILDDAGGTFDLTIRDFDKDQFFVMSCILVLNAYYKKDFIISKPLFYDIPDKNGITKHYRILYNADFIKISPTEKAIELSPEDIDLLMDNYDDVNVWKEKFPLESWEMKGFGIVTLFDATIESAISELKTNLLRANSEHNEKDRKFESIFRSIFKVPDLRVGLTFYNEEENMFINPPHATTGTNSFILYEKKELPCENAFLDCEINTILKTNKTYAISNVEKFAKTAKNEKFAKHLLKQKIKSCILAPVIKNDKLLGILELVSSNPRSLNSINAINLDLLLPYVVDTLDNYYNDLQNQIEAVIQREYTAIHSSVFWKFKKEAQKFYHTYNPNKDYIFKEIVFKDVYPLYGQIDVKSSSLHRNQTVKDDLKSQLKTLLKIFDQLKENTNLSILEQRKFEMHSYFEDLDLELKTDTEQQIQNYIQNEIHPIIVKSKVDEATEKTIKKYFTDIDPKTGSYYKSRKKFDDAMAIVNKKMASILDKSQVEAQKIFPHYFERFKSDGVEHNLYIGASISPQEPFDKIYLSNLRLWQLQTLCEMELEHHRCKSILPYELEVTSLILVFSSPISIRFRMDEKRFDVDGTYNARYEVVKKRIDKAHIKGTNERITDQEKITIVYSQRNEEKEYLKYIKFLQFKNILEPTIEQFDVEELQGVSGLKAIRIKVLNTISENPDDQPFQLE